MAFLCVSHNLGETNFIKFFTQCVFSFARSPAIFLPGRWSSNTFDIGFESACSATCIGVTHQGIRYIFWYYFAICVTLPRLIRNLCLQLGVFSHMAMTNLV